MVLAILKLPAANVSRPPVVSIAARLLSFTKLSAPLKPLTISLRERDEIFDTPEALLLARVQLMRLIPKRAAMAAPLAAELLEKVQLIALRFPRLSMAPPEITAWLSRKVQLMRSKVFALIRAAPFKPAQLFSKVELEIVKGPKLAKAPPFRSERFPTKRQRLIRFGPEPLLFTAASSSEMLSSIRQSLSVSEPPALKRAAPGPP